MTEPLGREEARRALDEDRARDDVTTALVGHAGDRPVEGIVRTQERCVVAGLPVAREVFMLLDPAAELDQQVAEGEWVEPGACVATVRAPARTLLAGERTALNFLQRLSGIATLTREAVDTVRGTGAIVTDTRKTTPGLRALEKYAVRVGGGENHRYSLGDAVLWKDNHWALLRAEGGTLRDALAAVPRGLPVTVEVEDEAQLEEALAAGVARVLVDNQPPDVVAAWACRCGPGVAIEASGGITVETAVAYARAGARYVSIGALTHSARAVAMSLAIRPR
ncbi:MAG: carboxylating nicotinate-nucleotide diphosphorylase [Gemmatimonadetes bacterium]|nr:carboxylating nicotinate-nucleotide diphosphorylase [Gemmatimonadota bacterium]